MLLALDIGIKNLAYCVGVPLKAQQGQQGQQDASGTMVQIRHWSLVNLTNLDNQAKPVCTVCGKPPKAQAPAPLGLVCGRHIPKESPQIYDETTGKPIIKPPTIGQLKAFLQAKGLDTKGQRPVLLERAEAVATMPLVKKKSVASFADNTSRLHDAIRDWIRRDWDHLKDVTQVYIEHQPVLKNPVMKTVQILIFATLRERLLSLGGTQPVEFYFIHAGKKVKGAEVGDAGYKDRKAGGEARVRAYLNRFPMGTEQHRWYQWWLGQGKKDDLADTLCMLLDATF
jgi:hypothetical protein